MLYGNTFFNFFSSLERQGVSARLDCLVIHRDSGIAIGKKEEDLYTQNYSTKVGAKRYELANHLGNVINIVSDRKIIDDKGANLYGTPSGKTNLSFNPEIIGYNDYYPFGMLLPNRHGQADSYRYGFQGQEKDDEVKGEGNSYNYKYRMHDPRVGRFFTVDPLFREYPHYTPYSFAGNKVIRFKELEGLEEKDAMVDWLRTQGMVVLDWQDKRSGFFKATGHLIDGGLLFSSGFALTASTEGVGAALGGGSLMTLGIAEMSLGIANFTKDKRASKANNFMELVGMQMEEKHGLTNAGAYLYYGQEVIEVGTSIRNAYKFIKSGEALRIPTSLRDLVKNSKAYVGTFNVFVSAPSRTITMTVEGLYDVFIANTPSEALRNLDLQSWKSTVEFFDANVNKVESKLGVKLGFEVLDKNGKLFVSDDFIFEVKDEAALRDFFKNLRKEVPQMEKRKKAVERAKRIQEREPRNYCFVSGTKVFTPEGLINIELLRKGDTIYSFNFKNNSFEPDIVENNFERLDDKIFRIVLGNNVIIEVTEEHPFMEYNLGKWIKAKDLEKILKEISIEFKMEYELSDSCFKVFSKEIKVEGKISDKGEIVLTDSIIKEEDNMFSVYKTFLILVIIVFLIVVIMNDTFFLIEKILYSVVLLLVLIFHSFFGKLLSVFLLPYYNSESELKLKRLKLKLIDKLK